MRAALLVALILASCAPPPTAAPSSPASAAASAPERPTATLIATAQPSASAAVPLIGIDVPSGSLFGYALDDEAIVMLVREADQVIRLIAIERSTGAVTRVHEITQPLGLGPISLRDGVVTFVEGGIAGSGPDPERPRWRIYAGRWRDPSSFRLLDEWVSPTLGGGDTWVPTPTPQTNGWEIVWMRGTSDTNDLVMRDADGTTRVVYRQRGAFVWALGRRGEIAVADIRAGISEATLALVTATGTRTIATRPLARGGAAVTWMGGLIVWSEGGFLRNVTTVELVQPSTGSPVSVKAPDGCAGTFVGATDRELVFVCGQRLVLLTPSSERSSAFGPWAVHVFPRGASWVDEARHRAFVISSGADDPRAGVGARF